MRLFPHLIRNVELRVYARSQGLTRRETRDLVNKCSEVHVSKAVEVARGMGYTIPDELLTADSGPVVGAGIEAIGDGTIIKRILEWLKSENGQAFIKILFMILMSFI